MKKNKKSKTINCPLCGKEILEIRTGIMTVCYSCPCGFIRVIEGD